MAKAAESKGYHNVDLMQVHVLSLPAAAFVLVLIQFFAMSLMHHHDSCPHTRQMLHMRENFVPNTLTSWRLFRIRANAAKTKQPFYADMPR